MWQATSLLRRSLLVNNQYLNVIVRNATKKAGGTVRNGRDSIGKRLGVKKFGGEAVIPGNIIIRQRGKTYHPGDNVGLGRDYTIWALVEGKVKFSFNREIQRNVVSVIPKGTEEAKLPVQKKRFVNRGYNVSSLGKENNEQKLKAAQ